MNKALLNMIFKRAAELGYLHKSGNCETPTHKDINVLQFAKHINIDHTLLQKVLSGKKKNPTYNTLKAILKGVALPCLDELGDPTFVKILTEIADTSNEEKQSVLKFIFGLKHYQK